jgi:hypothetical protein
MNDEKLPRKRNEEKLAILREAKEKVIIAPVMRIPVKLTPCSGKLTPCFLGVAWGGQRTFCKGSFLLSSRVSFEFYSVSF